MNINIYKKIIKFDIFHMTSRFALTIEIRISDRVTLKAFNDRFNIVSRTLLRC